MRELTDHKVGELNEAIRVQVMDDPDLDGACHMYSVEWENEKGSYVNMLRFQKGPLKEAGANGISVEALLAIVIDRLRGFQRGQFACRENALALTNTETALMWLQKRTRERISRGVEGTHKQ